jgi:multisubunit Na+/H+ antiporter MnhE subunit
MAENMRPPPARQLSVHRRATVWLAWWTLMMSLWVMIDDSLQFDELLAGAGAAAIAAVAAEFAAYQASVRYRVRPGWLLAAEILRLPAEVVRDTLTVFGALARMLVTGRAPEGGYAELPAGGPADEKGASADEEGGPVGDAGGMPGEAGRVLLTGVRSFAPNTFVLGIDDERGVLVVHRLVPEGAGR